MDSAESGNQMTGMRQRQLRSVGGLLPGAGCCHQLPHDTKVESTGVRRDPGHPTTHRDAPQHLAQALPGLLQLFLLQMLPTVLLFRPTLLRQVWQGLCTSFSRVCGNFLSQPHVYTLQAHFWCPLGKPLAQPKGLSFPQRSLPNLSQDHKPVEGREPCIFLGFSPTFSTWWLTHSVLYTRSHMRCMCFEVARLGRTITLTS